MSESRDEAHAGGLWQQTEAGLVLGGHHVEDIVQQYGSPLYIYDEAILQQQVAMVKDAFAGFDVHYSVKANPDPRVIGHFQRQLAGLEVASSGELDLALAAGCPAGNVLFAGPGKTDAALRKAVLVGIREIHIESVGEAQRLDAIANSLDTIVRVCIRVNPEPEMQLGAMRMGGRAAQFGVDEEMLPRAVEQIEAMSNLHLDGLHLFVGTQILDAELLLAFYEHIVEISWRVGRQTMRPVGSIDFGGGLGVPYFGHEKQLDLVSLRAGLEKLVGRIRDNHLTRESRLLIEPGRFLAAPAGIYVARVIDVKNSRGKTFVVLDGGMNHHLAASGNLGQTIKRNYPIRLVGQRRGERHVSPVEIVGPLCTPLDTLGRSVGLESPQIGDLLGIFMSGAYGRSASPLGFLSHDSPGEVYVDRDGGMTCRRVTSVSSPILGT